MPQFDIRSDLLINNVLNAVINSDTTTNGSIIDTADYDTGVMFDFAAIAYTAGTYTPLLEESNDSGMAGATVIPTANLIGTIADATLTAATPAGGQLPTIGVVETKRYVRLSIVSTSTGAATVVINAIRKPEILPAVN